MNANNRNEVDPVVLEIIRNLLIAVVDEGEINLSRTAFSPIIYEVKDYCISYVFFGSFDADAITEATGKIRPVCIITFVFLFLLDNYLNRIVFHGFPNTNF